jgi:sugar lactone lactonase YvrE
VCTIARLNVSLGGTVPQMTGETVIGSDFAWKVNQATFMLGPTGVALGSNGTLYVAQTLSNRITVIPDALTRTSSVVDGSSTLTSGGFLNAPLGMTIAPNGDVIAMNGNNGDAVEITPQGRQIAKLTLVRNGAGTLFGVAITTDGRGLVYVNDGSNAVDVAS